MKLMLNNRKNICALIFASMLFGVANLQGQNLSLYNDYLNKVYVFDNGTSKQIEHLPLNSYQIGNNAIAYEDNAGNFKIYQDNYVFSINGFVSEYFVSDNLIPYRLNTQLKVFDNGQNISLTTTVGAFSGSDEIIIFYDKLEQKLKAYYNSEIYELDDGLASEELDTFISGEDIVVYRDYKGYFNIFFDGEIIQLLYAERVKEVKAGRGIVAFIEDPINNFQIFYRGEFLEVDPFEPKSFQVGDDIAAYVDNNEHLIAFYGGDIITLAFDLPQFYEVNDELVIFSIQNYFKVFWRGNVYTLESYVPNNYLANNGIVAYVDEHGYLKVFTQGKTQTVSYEQIKDFEINGNTVNYKFGVKSQNIYLNGQTFTNN
jgi:hypothetical protein